jgi:hypothetical protein
MFFNLLVFRHGEEDERTKEKKLASDVSHLFPAAKDIKKTTD